MQTEINGVTITLTQEQVDYVNRQLNKQTPDDFFNGVITKININKPVIDYKKYPNQLFWFDRDGYYICSYDKGTHIFHFSTPKVWWFLSEDLGMGYMDICSFLVRVVYIHFHIANAKPNQVDNLYVTKIQDHFREIY